MFGPALAPAWPALFISIQRKLLLLALPRRASGELCERDFVI